MHWSFDAIIYKKFMEFTICFDLFFIMLNFPYWVDLSSSLGEPEVLQASRKLELAFAICFAPFILVKVLLRFYAQAQPLLQMMRVVILMTMLQLPICMVFSIINRANCGHLLLFNNDGGEKGDSFFCLEILPEQREGYDIRYDLVRSLSHMFFGVLTCLGTISLAFVVPLIISGALMDIIRGDAHSPYINRDYDTVLRL